MLRSRLSRLGGSRYSLIMPETLVLQAVRPGGGLHDPAAREDLETLGGIGALDDLDGPGTVTAMAPLSFGPA